MFFKNKRVVAGFLALCITGMLVADPIISVQANTPYLIRPFVSTGKNILEQNGVEISKTNGESSDPASTKDGTSNSQTESNSNTDSSVTPEPTSSPEPIESPETSSIPDSTSSESESSSSSSSSSSSDSSSGGGSTDPVQAIKEGLFLGDLPVNEGDVVEPTQQLTWIQAVELQGMPVRVDPIVGLKATDGILIDPVTQESTSIKVQEDGSFMLPALEIPLPDTDVPTKTNGNGKKYQFQVTGLPDVDQVDASTGALTIGNVKIKIKEEQVTNPVLPEYTPTLYNKNYNANKPNENKLQSGDLVTLKDQLYFVITKEDLQNDPPEQGDIKEGVIYRIPLPNPLVSFQKLENMPIRVQTTSGDLEIAKVNAQEGSREIEITFKMQDNTEGITLEDIINLNLAFACQIDVDLTKPDEKGQIQIPVTEDTSITVVIEEYKPAPPEPPKLTKSSTEMNGNGVSTWTITYTPPKGLYDGESPTKLVDVIPEGLEYIATPDLQNPTYDENTRTLTYDLSNLGENKDSITFTYQTKITEDRRNQFWQDGKKQDFVNTIKALNEQDQPVFVGENPLEAVAKSGMQALKPLVEKKGQPLQYNPDIKQYTTQWIMKVEPMDATFHHLTLVDIYAEGLSIADGITVEIQPQTGERFVCDPQYVQHNRQERTLTIDLKEYQSILGQAPFSVLVTTNVGEEYVNNIQSNVPTTIEPLKNTVKAEFGTRPPTEEEGNNIHTSLPSTTQPTNLNSPLMVKTAIGFNHREHAVEWRVTINPTRTPPLVNPNLKKVQFEDRFNRSEGNYNWLSFGMTPEQEQAQIADITNQIKTNYPGVDVTVKIEQDQDKKLLQVNLDNAGTEPITFQFKTYAQGISGNGGWAANVSNIRYTNTGLLNAENTTIIDSQGEEKPLKAGVSSTASTVINRAYTLRKEDISYDPNTSIMTWRIRLNERQAPLGKVKVTDILPDGMSYVPWSATLNGEALPQEEQVDGNYVTYTGNELVFHLERIRDSYEIQFQTKIDREKDSFKKQKKISFTNKSKLEVFYQNKWVKTADGNHTVSIDNTVLDKSTVNRGSKPVYDVNGSKAVDYLVKLNPLRLNLLNELGSTQVVLEDRLDAGLLLDTDTLQVFEGITTVKDVNGTYIPSLEKGEQIQVEYEYDKLSNYLTIKIPDPTKAYILTYTAYVTRAGVELRNHIRLYGSVMEENVSGVDNDVQTINFQASGNASLRPPKDKYTSVAIKKTTANNKPLVGAKIGLYAAQDESTLLGVGMSDSQGNCVMSVLKSQISNLDTLYYKELEAPQGYLLDQEWHTVSMSDIQNDKVPVLKNNPIQPNANAVVTVRLESTAGGVLSNGIFGLYENEDSQVPIRHATTNRFGELIFDGLKPGAYYVKQIEAPKGYDKSDQTFVVNLVEHNRVDLKVLNKPSKVSLSIKKIDAETKALLDGAIFELYHQSDLSKPVAPVGVTENGVASFKDLTPGETYILKEIQSPSGYFFHSTEYTISPVIGQDSELTIENTKYPVTLNVLVQDPLKNKPLKGAKLKLTLDPEGKNIVSEDIITDEEGRCIFPGLLQQTKYYLWETESPAGYQSVPQSFEITTPISQTMDYVVDNHEIPVSITVVKKGSQTQVPLANAEFQLTKDPQGLIPASENKVTGADGVCVFDNLVPGTYYLKEVKAPEGYLLSDKIYPCEVLSVLEKQPFEIEVADDPIPVNLVIHKIDAETLLPLAEAEFQLFSDVELTKPVGGIQKSNEQGIAIFRGIVPGKAYYLKETKAPQNYLENPSVYKITPKIGQDFEITVRNTKHPVSLTVIKQDIHSDKPLQGAKFRLTLDEDGQNIIGEAKITDQSGKAIFDLLVQNSIYYLWEIEAPDGYISRTDPIVIRTGTEAELEYVVKNQQIPVSVVVNKKDAVTQKLLRGAKFRLTRDLEGKELAAPDATTTRSGRARFANLLPGTYYLWELEAPKGYSIPKQEPYICEVLPKQSFEITIKNSPLPVPFTLLKKDAETMQPLEGAIFQLYKDDKKLGDPQTTGADGTAIFENLIPGETYYIQEIQPPPAYVASSAIYKVVPSVEGNNQVEVLNTKSPVELTILKRDEFNKEPKAGAKFKLTLDKKGTIIYGKPIVTKADGKAVFEGLVQNTTYYLWEMEAPEGYQRHEKPIPITIARQEKLEYIVENKLLPTSITVEKKDAVTGQPLSGAKFRLSNDTSTKLPVKEDLFTSEEGICVFDQLCPGDYYLREITAPEGYFLSEKVYEFNNVKPGEHRSITIENEPKPVSLTVTNIDTETAKRLKDVKFAIYTDEQGENQVGEIQTTTSEGMCTFPELIPGKTYYLKEIQPAPDYESNTVIFEITPVAGQNSFVTVRSSKYPVKLEVLKQDTFDKKPLAEAQFQLTIDKEGKNVVGQALTTNKDGKLTFEPLLQNSQYYLWELKEPQGYQKRTEPILIVTGNDRKVEHTVNNTKIPASLTVKKQDVETKEPLQGAIFRLTLDMEGMIPVVEDKMSNDEGICVFKDLNPGTYYLWEMQAPKGYEVSEQVYTIELLPEQNGEIVVSNRPSPVSLIVHKKDVANDQPLANAIFGLFTGENKDILVIEPQVTNQEGTVVFENLSPRQTYYLRELQAPDGYVQNITEYEIVVQVGETIELDIYNTKMPVSAVLIKQDAETGEPLEGAKFFLTTDIEGKNVVSDAVITNKEGKAVFENLLPDTTYYAWEQEAPEGYIKEEAPISILTPSKDSAEYSIPNYILTVKMFLTIKYRDTNQPLVGEQFLLSLDPEGKIPVGPVVTSDVNGQCVFEGLKPNTIYYIWRINPVTGMPYDNKPIQVQVGENMESNFNVFFEKDKEEVTVVPESPVSTIPKTGFETYETIWLFGLFSSIAAGAVLALSYKKKFGKSSKEKKE